MLVIVRIWKEDVATLFIVTLSEWSLTKTQGFPCKKKQCSYTLALYLSGCASWTVIYVFKRSVSRWIAVSCHQRCEPVSHNETKRCGRIFHPFTSSWEHAVTPPNPLVWFTHSISVNKAFTSGSDQTLNRVCRSHSVRKQAGPVSGITSVLHC